MRWSAEHTITLIEKLAGLGIALVRKFIGEPERAITRIVDLTQQVRQDDEDIDAELDRLRAAQREGGGE